MSPVSDITLGRSARKQEIGPYCLVDARYRCGERLSSHAHTHAYVSFVLCGAMQERVDGETHHLGPGSLIIRRAHVPHQNIYGPRGTRLTIIKLPSPVNPDEGLGSTAIRSSATMQSGPACALALRLFASILARPLKLETLDEELQRIIDVAGVGDGRRGEKRRPAWLDRAIECIHDTLCESFSVVLLAEDLGVHQTHLSRTFRRHIGSTISEYRRRLRVVGAARSLRAGNATIARLAFEFGFADQAHLTRELHRELGTTPARLRWACGRSTDSG